MTEQRSLQTYLRSVSTPRGILLVLAGVVALVGAACVGESGGAGAWDVGAGSDASISTVDGAIVCGRPDQVIRTLEAAEALGECDVYRGSFEFEDMDVGNFERLPELREIRGDFELIATKIDTFEGLEHLTHIGGHFGFSGLGDSISFEGLSSLRSVQGTLSIRFSDLRSLPDFVALRSTRGLYIGANPGLKNLDGLVGLKHVRSGAIITGNRFICEAQAREFLEAIPRVDGEIRASGNGFKCMRDE